MNYRSTFNTLIKNLINNGEYEKAFNVIKKSIELIPDEAVKYDHFSVQLVEFLIDIKIKSNIETNELENEIADIIGERSNDILPIIMITE